MIEGTVFHTRVPAMTAEATARIRQCPDCDRGLVHRDGCVVCVSCGYSKCG